MRAVFLIGSLALAAASSRADISTYLKEVPNGLGAGSLTYDLMVHVSGGDDWTSTSMKAVLSGAEFFNHPAGANHQPNPALFALYPTLPWDTFFTVTQGWPNTPEQGVIRGSGTPVWGPKLIDATWFEIPPNGGDGDYVLCRMSLVDMEPEWQLNIQGAHTTIKGGAQLYPYSFVIPEPATFASLAAGLAAGLCAMRASRGTEGTKQ